ncbi:hypothetical protein ABB37_09422 [Leptomonas pyrrhocoris]|uniref:Flagellar attachment zone protein 1 conserved domain-containing protein n=1 Tax=Leptomonas pyrrhocoris TaxID=157538 RepID=A0A0N0DRH6_LEPPY|nr:hypothetical protein ABB37_09422 [Leptomonas pyrrhocoris]KPA74154.1 hypothetical protein ABB37_09422 [Leptomonas pyrrhocoris]|eukprot:XP_015652593.1 hypothetical protein ABB37_09422 [Leptomonas pyrrhocoris]
MFFNTDAANAYFLRSHSTPVYDDSEDFYVASATSGGVARGGNTSSNGDDFTMDFYERSGRAGLPSRQQINAPQRTAYRAAAEQGVEGDDYAGGYGRCFQPSPPARPPMGAAAAPRRSPSSVSAAAQYGATGRSGADLLYEARSRGYAPGTTEGDIWSRAAYLPRASRPSSATVPRPSQNVGGGVPAPSPVASGPVRLSTTVEPVTTSVAGLQDTGHGRSTGSGGRNYRERPSSAPAHRASAPAVLDGGSASAGVLPAATRLTLGNVCSDGARTFAQGSFTPQQRQPQRQPRRAPVAPTPPQSQPPLNCTPARRSPEGWAGGRCGETAVSLRPFPSPATATPRTCGAQELRNRYAGLTQDRIMTDAEEGSGGNVSAGSTHDLAKHGGASQNIPSSRHARQGGVSASQEGRIPPPICANAVPRCWGKTADAVVEPNVATAASASAPQRNAHSDEEDGQEVVDSNDFEGPPRAPWWTVDVTLAFLAGHYTSPAEEAEAMLAAATAPSPANTRVVRSVRCRTPVLPADASLEEAWEMTRSFLRCVALSSVEDTAVAELQCVPQVYSYFDKDFNQYVLLDADTLAIASALIRVVMVVSSTDVTVSQEPSLHQFYPQQLDPTSLSPPAMTSTTPASQPPQHWVTPGEHSGPPSRDPSGPPRCRRLPFDNDVDESSPVSLSMIRQKELVQRQRRRQPHQHDVAAADDYALPWDGARLHSHDIYSEEDAFVRERYYYRYDPPHQEEVNEQQQQQQQITQKPAEVWDIVLVPHEEDQREEEEDDGDNSMGGGAAAAVVDPQLYARCPVSGRLHRLCNAPAVLRGRLSSAPHHAAVLQRTPAPRPPTAPTASFNRYGDAWDVSGGRVEGAVAAAAASRVLRPSPPMVQPQAPPPTRQAPSLQQKRPDPQYFDGLLLMRSTVSSLQPAPPSTSWLHTGLTDSCASRGASQTSLLAPSPPRSSPPPHQAYRLASHPYFDASFFSPQRVPPAAGSITAFASTSQLQRHTGASSSSSSPHADALGALLRRSAEAMCGKSQSACLSSEHGAQVKKEKQAPNEGETVVTSTTGATTTMTAQVAAAVGQENASSSSSSPPAKSTLCPPSPPDLPAQDGVGGHVASTAAEEVERLVSPAEDTATMEAVMAIAITDAQPEVAARKEDSVSEGKPAVEEHVPMPIVPPPMHIHHEGDDNAVDAAPPYPTPPAASVDASFDDAKLGRAETDALHSAAHVITTDAMPIIDDEAELQLMEEEEKREDAAPLEGNDVEDKLLHVEEEKEEEPTYNGDEQTDTYQDVVLEEHVSPRHTPAVGAAAVAWNAHKQGSRADTPADASEGDVAAVGKESMTEAKNESLAEAPAVKDNVNAAVAETTAPAQEAGTAKPAEEVNDDAPATAPEEAQIQEKEAVTAKVEEGVEKEKRDDQDDAAGGGQRHLLDITVEDSTVHHSEDADDGAVPENAAGGSVEATDATPVGTEDASEEESEQVGALPLDDAAVQPGDVLADAIVAAATTIDTTAGSHPEDASAEADHREAVAASEEPSYQEEDVADQPVLAAVAGANRKHQVAPSAKDEVMGEELDLLGAVDVNDEAWAELEPGSNRENSNHCEIGEAARSPTPEGAAHTGEVEMTATHHTTATFVQEPQDAKMEGVAALGVEPKEETEVHSSAAAPEGEEPAPAHATCNEAHFVTVHHSTAKPTLTLAAVTVADSSISSSGKEQRLAPPKLSNLDRYSGMTELSTESAEQLSQLQDDLDAPPMFQRKGANITAVAAASLSTPTAPAITTTTAAAAGSSGAGVSKWTSVDAPRHKPDNAVAACTSGEAVVGEARHPPTTTTTHDIDNEDAMTDAPMNAFHDSMSTPTPTFTRPEEDEDGPGENTSVMGTTNTGDAADPQMHIACSYTSVPSERASAGVNVLVKEETQDTRRRSVGKSVEERDADANNAVPPSASARLPSPLPAVAAEEAEEHEEVSFTHAMNETIESSPLKPVSTSVAAQVDVSTEAVPLTQTPRTTITGSGKIFPPDPSPEVHMPAAVNSKPLVELNDEAGYTQQQPPYQPGAASHTNLSLPLGSSTQQQTTAAPREESAMRKTMVLLGFPGSAWEYIMTHHYEPMHDAFVTDASAAVDVPHSAIQDVRYSKGSLMVDLYVLHPAGIGEQEVRDLMCNYEYPHLWTLYEAKKRERKRLLHGEGGGIRCCDSQQTKLSALEEVKWSPYA